MGGVEAVEETVAAADGDREDPEVELVHQAVLQQRAVELPGAEFQDVLARLRLELGDLARDVRAEERGVPLGLPSTSLMRRTWAGR